MANAIAWVNATPFPLAWYKLNDGSGTTAKDSSGNAINGTLAGSPLPTWNVGSLSFAGGTGTGQVHLMDMKSQLLPMSFSFWWTPASTPMASNVALAYWGRDSEGDAARFLRLFSTGSGPKVQATFNNGGGNSISTTFTESASTQYNHIIVVTGSLITWYVNGSSNATITPTTSTFDKLEFLEFGGTGVASQTANGTIDDFRVYNIALSSADATRIFNAGPS